MEKPVKCRESLRNQDNIEAVRGIATEGWAWVPDDGRYKDNGLAIMLRRAAAYLGFHVTVSKARDSSGRIGYLVEIAEEQ